MRALAAAILLPLSAGLGSVSTAIPTAADQAQGGGFALVQGTQAATLMVDKGDFAVVSIAAECLAGDVAQVTGIKPRVTMDFGSAPGHAVLIGTIGKSALIDRLMKEGKLQAGAIRGKWECFVMARVKNPLPGIEEALVIAGSDRRGTAYGVFQLSEAIGVSPWVWWADVKPAHRASLFINLAAPLVQGPPSVQYRGIFLNDEDWGLQPWAAKTFEPETKDIGPKTYAKVCELLLRLKANYLWPAMHPCTKAFNFYPENKLVADRYAIVMGSSHAEPMLRNNVSEWTGDKEGFNYETNRDAILKYWEERVKENSPYENTYSLGIRGVHDSGMQGGGSSPQGKVALLQKVISDQREMLARLVNPKAELVPQILVPYKEALALYQSGLKVPDDVTLVWPDDNHGYIRQLSNADEQKRSGGSGVYYHLSYWGKPEDYLWLNTIAPALIWEEMRKAYDHGARRLWVANVGDIKPGEIGMEFFLRLAWNIEDWDEDVQRKFLTEWARRDFGVEYAPETAAIMNEYYRLNSQVKPEHLLLAHFSENYGETERRLRDFEGLVAKADALYGMIPADKRDAFYELVLYPVRCSALMNEKWLNSSPEKARAAYDAIQKETFYYDEELAGGKWRFMMSAAPRKGAVFQAPGVEAKSSPVTGDETGNPRYASLEAGNPSRKASGREAEWRVIRGLGNLGSSVALLPTNAAVTKEDVLEYDFVADASGPAKVQVYSLPTHATDPAAKLRYEVSIDNGPAQTVDIDTKELSKEWSANVINAVALGVSDHVLSQSGKHTVRLRPLDPGIVFEKIVVDFGGVKPSQLGPPIEGK